MKIKLSGKIYETVPFKLEQLEIAGPYIDNIRNRQNASIAEAEAIYTANPGITAEELKQRIADKTTMVEVIKGLNDMVGVLSSVIPGESYDSLRGKVGLDDVDDLKDAVAQIMAESGLKQAAPGEGSGVASVPLPPVNRQQRRKSSVKS